MVLSNEKILLIPGLLGISFHSLIVKLMRLNSLILRYGLIATALIVGIPLITFAIFGPADVSFEGGEIIGYGSIILSLSIFVFLGVRRFRDDFNEGRLGFLQALKVGLLITLIPSAGFGLYNYVYTEWMDPGFVDRYFEYNLDKLEGQLSAEEFQIEKTNMESQKDLFTDPFLNFGVMFATVFLIGVVITVLVGLILRKDVPELEIA